MLTVFFLCNRGVEIVWFLISGDMMTLHCLELNSDVEYCHVDLRWSSLALWGSSMVLDTLKQSNNASLPASKGTVVLITAKE